FRGLRERPYRFGEQLTLSSEQSPGNHILKAHQETNPTLKPDPEYKMPNELPNTLLPQATELFHQILSKTRLKSSGDWVFKLPAYQQWREAAVDPLKRVEGGENCLWLQGNVGAGKTMLMSTIIDQLQSEATSGLNHDDKVIYYYFERSGGQSPYQAVHTLLRQMCDGKDIPLPRFLAEERSHGSYITQNTSNEMNNKGVYLANLGLRGSTFA
ncbi:hypothetical protein F5Y08DRAFT_348118, partial [Xylaria arbuscula]